MRTRVLFRLAVFLVSITAIVAPVHADNIVIDNRPWSYIVHSPDWNSFTIRPQVNWPEDADRPRELSVDISGLTVSGDLYVGNTLTLSGTVDMKADPGIHGWWVHSAVACSYGYAKLTHDGTLDHYEPSPLKWAACDAYGGDTGWKWRIIPNDQSQTWTFSFEFTPTEAGTYTLKAFGYVDASYWRQHVGPNDPGLSWYDSDNQADSFTFEVQVLRAMDSFVIDHAKIDFKKKPDDDKVRVQGKLDPASDVAISEDVTVTVGPLSPQTITMEEKGKKGDKWEYKRPKGESGIKHMKIHWKDGEAKFDIRVDKADLGDMSTWTNPVTISIQIGDDVGSESILMREKKHHWDYKYKAEKPKNPKAIDIEPPAITDPLKVVAYPNPIRDVDTATFQVLGTLATQVEEIRVQIYDLSGRLVWEDATLGSELDWHTDCLSGDYLANGIYLYRVQLRIDGSWISQDLGKIAVLR